MAAKPRCNTCGSATERCYHKCPACATALHAHAEISRELTIEARRDSRIDPTREERIARYAQMAAAKQPLFPATSPDRPTRPATRRPAVEYTHPPVMATAAAVPTVAGDLYAPRADPVATPAFVLVPAPAAVVAAPVPPVVADRTNPRSPAPALRVGMDGWATSDLYGPASVPVCRPPLSSAFAAPWPGPAVMPPRPGNTVPFAPHGRGPVAVRESGAFGPPGRDRHDWPARCASASAPVSDRPAVATNLARPPPAGASTRANCHHPPRGP